MKAKFLLLFILVSEISFNSLSQHLGIAGNWKFNAGSSEMSGTPTYRADSIINITQQGNEIIFERINFNPNSTTVEKLRLDAEVSNLVLDNVTKSITITYSKEEKLYTMNSKYSKPDQPGVNDFLIIQKWSVDADGRLVRWLISQDAYKAKLIYNK
jgi:hypothetical protein